MQSYFTRLFDYDEYANKLMLQGVLDNGPPEKPVQFMAHLLAAQQIWLNRCKGLPTIGYILWPDWKDAVVEQTIVENHRHWTDFLQHLKPDDFDELILYQNSKGESFQNKLTDILAHVINHGTHHRAQIGQHLKLSGAELPPTDYIFFLRDLGL